jgi:hypothetical protein
LGDDAGFSGKGLPITLQHLEQRPAVHR